jgi:nucleotide-binding universal stress UspA family protein
MWRHIVVPVDGSDVSFAVLRAACALQRAHGAAVDAVYVIEVPRALPLTTDLPEQRDALDRVHKAVDALAAAEGATVRFRFIQARGLGAAILAAAQEADLLMVASHGVPRLNSPWGEPLSMFLFRKAPCAVVLYRGPASETTAASLPS